MARIKNLFRHSVKHIVHFLKDVDQWQSHNPVWCRFLNTICEIEIGVDGLIAVSTIAEYVASCDPAVVEMFALRSDYHSGTCIRT